MPSAAIDNENVQGQEKHAHDTEFFRYRRA